jgi:hypothetical protein
MITRDGVIGNAHRYLNVPVWTPTVDTHVFRPASPARMGTFHSCFVVGGVPLPPPQQGPPTPYTVIPYVYGRGGEIPEPSAICQEILNGKCPGGWDKDTGKGTGKWYALFHSTAMRNLAGIDCSQYVMKSWGFERCLVSGTEYGTPNLPRLCLRIRPNELKKGDILLKPGHVVIFEGWASSTHNQAWLCEATGTPEPEPRDGHPHLRRSFNPGSDEIGCVVRHSLTVVRVGNEVQLQDKSGNFTPYSPFPQYIDPSPSGPIADPQPEISVRIAGSGDIGGLHLFVDGAEVNYVGLSVSDPRHRFRGYAEISWNPSHALASGRHVVRVRADNAIIGQCFRGDEFTWEFEVSQRS